MKSMTVILALSILALAGIILYSFAVRHTMCTKHFPDEVSLCVWSSAYRVVPNEE